MIVKTVIHLEGAEVLALRDVTWGMFSPEGNAVVGQAVVDAVTTIGIDTDPMRTFAWIAQVARDQGHGEAVDTSVRETVLWALDQMKNGAFPVYRASL